MADNAEYPVGGRLEVKTSPFRARKNTYRRRIESVHQSGKAQCGLQNKGKHDIRDVEEFLSFDVSVAGYSESVEHQAKEDRLNPPSSARY